MSDLVAASRAARLGGWYGPIAELPWENRFTYYLLLGCGLNARDAYEAARVAMSTDEAGAWLCYEPADCFPLDLVLKEGVSR